MTNSTEENIIHHNKFSHTVGLPCSICNPNSPTEGFCKLMEDLGCEFIDVTDKPKQTAKITHDSRNK